jgi:hypothetical protein
VLEADRSPKHSGTPPTDEKLSGRAANSLMVSITREAAAYLKNVWLWIAGYKMDSSMGQVDIYMGRGLLIESQGPAWLYGTASVHLQLYNYNLAGARHVFLGLIHTESVDTPKVHNDLKNLRGLENRDMLGGFGCAQRNEIEFDVAHLGFAVYVL